MLIEADHRLGDARREVHRHIGDFTLFWSGVFPEALRRLQELSGAIICSTIRPRANCAYYIASTIRDDENEDECDVLERLSHDFELCVYGLGEVRREWERQTPDAGESSGRLWIN